MRSRASVFLLILATLPAAAAPLLPTTYAGWERTTALLLNYKIPGHLDNFRIPSINQAGTTVSPVAKDGKRFWDYPKGTIILKEVYQGTPTPAKDAKPFRLYGMIKDPGSKQARGGWIGVYREVATGKETVVDTPLCIDCHSYANGAHPCGDKNPTAEFRDYVYFPYVKAK